MRLAAGAKHRMRRPYLEVLEAKDVQHTDERLGLLGLVNHAVDRNHDPIEHVTVQSLHRTCYTDTID
jgi:hypothetical protein